MEAIPAELPVIKSRTGPPAWLKRIFPLLLRLVLGGVFLFAGILKAIDPGAFAQDLRRFYILPEELLSITAAYVPYLEIIVGVALILRIFYGSALLLSGGLLITFGIFLASAIWRGLDITCGCFGKALTSPATTGMVRDAILLLIWVFLVWMQTRHETKEPRAAVIGTQG